MKKALLPILAISILIAMPVFGDNLPAGDIPAFSGGLDIWKLLEKALNWFFNAAIFVAALYIVYAGWQYVTAGGDEEKAKKGLNNLIYALIGVGIALLAKGLIYVIGQFVTGTAITF